MKSYQIKKTRSEEICNAIETLEFRLNDLKEKLKTAIEIEQEHTEEPWYSDRVDETKVKIQTIEEIMKTLEKIM